MTLEKFANKYLSLVLLLIAVPMIVIGGTTRVFASILCYIVAVNYYRYYVENVITDTKMPIFIKTIVTIQEIILFVSSIASIGTSVVDIL